MKKYISILFCFIVLSIATYGHEVEQPREGKCLVYITRPSSMAIIIGFKVFDGEDFLGNLKANNYIAYECEPGQHVFIVKSETTDFAEANLEANRVYVLNVEARNGIIKARAKFKPLDRHAKKYEKEKKGILKLLAKNNKGKSIAEIENDSDDFEISEDTPNKTMQNFWKKKNNNKKITQLTEEMYFE